MFNSSINPELKSQIQYNFNASNELSSLRAKIIPQTITEFSLPILESQIRNEELTAVDECLLSNDEIQQNSLLNKGNVNKLKFEKDAFNPHYTIEKHLIKLLANFTGGLVTGGKGKEELDGLLPVPNFKVFGNLLEKLREAVKDKNSKEAQIIQNLQVGINKLTDISTVVEAASDKSISENELYHMSMGYAKKVDQLKRGQSELFFGGWMNPGEGGHSNIYEISRREDNDNFDVFLYTSIPLQTTDAYNTGNKNRVVPYVRYSNVPAEILLFKNSTTHEIFPGFIQKFMELHVLAKQNSGKTISKEDLLRIFDYLEAYRAPVALAESGAITGNRAGTCLPSVTKTYIRKHSEHLGLYKQIMFHLKLLVIESTYPTLEKTLKSDSDDGEVARRLYKGLCYNLLRRTAKCLEGSNGFGQLISADVAFEARATAHDLLKRINECETRIEIENSKKNVPSDTKLAEVDRQRNKRADFKQQVTVVTSNKVSKSTAIPDFDIVIDIQKTSATSLLNAIALTKHKMKVLMRTRSLNYLKVYALQFHHLIDQIPLPKISGSIPQEGFKVNGFDAPFWDKFTEKELVEVQMSLIELAKMYAGESSCSEDFLTRRFASILPLHALTHFLALKIDSMKLQHCPEKHAAHLEAYNAFSVFASLELEDLQFLDLKEFERIKAAESYFKAFKTQVIGKSAKMLFPFEESSKIIKTNVEKNPGNGIYWAALLEANPGLLKDATIMANNLYPDLSESQIENEYQAMCKAMEQYNIAFQAYQIQLNAYDSELNLYNIAFSAWSRNSNHHKGPQPQRPNLRYPMAPSKPPEPIRKVNLALETKLTLVMESTDYQRNKMMEDFGFDYIDNLRLSFFMTRAFSFKDKLTKVDLDFSVNCTRESPYTPLGYSYAAQIDIAKPSLTMKGLVLNMHRPLTKPEHQQFFQNHPVTKRDSASWNKDKAEGNALNNKNSKKDDFYSRVLRILSQYEIVPDQLIYELTKEISSLKDPSLQALIMRLFFRSPIVDGEIMLGSGEFIRTSKALFDNALNFINSGLGIALKSNEGIDGARFFYDLSFILCKFLKDANDLQSAELLNQADQIDRWLNNEDLLEQKKLSDADISSLHFYRLLFLSLKPNLTIEEMAKCYASFIKYKANPAGSNAWKTPVLDEMACKFIYSLTEKSKNSPREFYNELGRSIFEKLKLGSSHEDWQVDAINGYPYLSMGGWKIDLALGTVYSPQGQLEGIAQNYPWEKQDNFKRVFKAQVKLNYTSLGKGCVGFTHPKFKGAFRLVPDGRYTSVINYKIQRQMEGHGDVWFEYCEPGSLPDFPATLMMDHAYFVPISQYGHDTYKFDGHKINGFITDLNTLEINFTVDSKGKILEADAKGTPKENGYELDFLFSSKYTSSSPIQGLTRFDMNQNIVTFRKKNNSLFSSLSFYDITNPIEKIAFPRYTSIDNNELSFFEFEGKMLWSENREFEIPLSMPEQMLGTIKNYLYLQSTKDKNKGMLLVPIQVILNSGTGPKSNGTLDITNTLPIWSENKEKNELIGLQRYVAFEIDNKKIVPTSIEAKLFLAAIYLSQTKYEEAVYLLRTLKSSEIFSEMSRKMLSMIQRLPLGEDHPDAKMVQLHALRLEINQKEIEANEKIEVYFDKNSDLVRSAAHMEKILQSSNNVSKKCQFTIEEEQKIIGILVNEVKKNFAQLKKLPELHSLKCNLDVCLNTLKTKEKFFKLHKEDELKTTQISAGQPFKERESLLWNSQVSLVEIIKKPVDPSSWIFAYQTKAEKDAAKEIELKEKKQRGTYSFYDTYYDYSDCFEHAKIDYDNQKKYYDNQITLEVSWLTGYPSLPTYQYTNHVPNMYFNKNGKLFREVYEAADSGNQSRIRDLIFRLSAWKQARQQQNSILDCLLMILCYPDQFPKKIDFINADSHAKFNFLWDVTIAYSKVSKSIPDDILGNKNAVKSNAIVVDDNRFPVFTRSAFEKSEISLSDIGNYKLPLKPKFDSLNERNSTLETWQKFLVEDETQAILPYKDFEFKLNEGLLTDREGNYQNSLENDLKILQADYDAGKVQNAEGKLKTISKFDCLELGEQIRVRLKKVNAEKAKKQLELLKKANRKNASQSKREAELARIGGKVDPLMSFQDCVDCLLSFDERSYTVKNTNLNSPAIIQPIADLTLEIVDLKSEEAELTKLLKLTEQIVENSDTLQALATRRYLCQNLDATLQARYHFDNFTAEEKVVLRVFCGQMGMIPFKKQTDLMEKMLETMDGPDSTFKDIVIQLIMGGGKTSVIATILLFLSAKRAGRMSYFIVPASLLDTVTANLGESMKIAFNKDVIPMNMDRDSLTPYKLKAVEKSLIQAEEKEAPVIISATTLQGFELELLSVCRKIKDLNYKIKEIENDILDAKVESKILTLRENKKTNIDVLKNLMEKCGLLDRSLTLSQTKADAIIDEVDLILDSFQELNFVDGEKIHVEPVRNDLMLSLYSAIIDQNMKISTLVGSPSVAEAVRLASNQQSLLNSEMYLQHVTPVLARNFATKFKEISSKLGSFTYSYIRYASGQMPDELEKFVCNTELKFTEEEAKKFAHNMFSFSVLKEDLHFLEWLRGLQEPAARLEQELVKAKKFGLVGSEEVNLLKSKLEKALKDKETADLIAQSKHLLVDLTKTTLSKVSGRNYGETPDSEKPGKIIPYLGVHTPATTEFGYHWEAAAYHYQFGVSNKPKPEAIFEIAKMMTTVANRYVEENGEDFFLTPEYTGFFKMFQVKLDEIELAGNVEKAIDYVSKDPQKLLALQHDLVAKYATYSSERLSSNGLDLTNLLGSRRAMSGTPWNVQGYEEKLSRSFNPDIGTEGRILQKLALREKAGKIMEVDFNEDNPNQLFTIHDFLSQVFEKFKAFDLENNIQIPTFRKFRGIIEAGGLFKSFGTHMEVARGWMEFIAKKQQEEMAFAGNKKSVDPRIEAVLFFHKDEGQAQPNTLYAWRKGATSPERIGSTSVSALKAKGLIPENYVVYYDERHATGVDILQIPEAVNLITFDHMLLRNATQSTMRMRQFLFEQDGIIVTSKDTKKSMYNQGKSFEDLFLNSAKVQSLRKTQSMVRYFSQQINFIFRKAAVGKVREKIKALCTLTDLNDLNQRGILQDFSNHVELFEQFFVTFMSEEPYLQHGALTNMKNTKAMLKELLAKKLERFITIVSDFDICLAVKKEAAALKSWIDESKSLPENWKDLTGHIGVEQEVEVAIQAEVAKLVNVEVEKEIEQELEKYELLPRNSIRPEYKMTLGQFTSLVTACQQDIVSSSSIFTLKNRLKDFSYGFGNEKRLFEDIFSDNIFGTEGYFFPCQNREVLSVFNKVHRPSKQILAIKVNEEFRWLLLSEHEAKDVKELLLQAYAKPISGLDVNNVWLIQPDGSLLAKGDEMTPFPVDDQPVLDGLLEINALLGNMDYINKAKNRDEANGWFETHPKLKIHFLKLRTFRNALQHQLLKTSVPIAIAEGQNVGSGVGLSEQMSKERRELEKTRQGKYRPVTDLAAKTLTSPKNLRQLITDFVPFLGIDYDKKETDPLTSDAIKLIAKDKKFEGLKGSNLEFALREEIGRLNKKQFSNLSIFHIPFLKSYQLKWLPLNMVQHLQHAEQICLDLPQEEGGRQYFLKKAQVLAMDESQRNLIPFVKPKYYKEFSENWQITSVLPQDLIHIDPAQGHHLTEGQIKGITREDLKNHSQFFKKLFESFSAEQIGSFIHGDLIEVIPVNHYDLITDVQIREMTDPTLIPRLEEIAATSGRINEGLWTSWISPMNIKHIKATQVKYLEIPAQIAEVSRPLVKYLDSDSQVPYISEKQVLGLEGEDQIQACPDLLVRHLDTDTQIQLITLRQVEFIVGSQVRALDTEEKIQACPDILASNFEIKQLVHITKRQVPYLKTKPQIQAMIEEEYIDCLTADVTDHTINQIPFITDLQLKMVKKNQFKGLSNAQLLKLSKLKRWEQESIGEYLTKEQIQKFDCKALIDLLSESQVNAHLTKNQVPLLTKKLHIQACPDMHVPFLSLDQIKEIKPAQVPFIKGGAQVKAIPSQAEFVSMLQKEHFISMIGSQVPFLTAAQIAQFDLEKEIKMLDRQQLQFLGDQGFPVLEREVVRDIQNDPKFHQKMQFVNPEFLNEITNAKAAESVTEAQVNAFGSDKFNKLKAGHPLFAKATAEITKDLNAEHVTKIAVDKLQYLSKLDAIRAVSMRNIVHLTRAQIAQTSASVIVYVIGVLTLGVAVCIVSMVAYPLWIPLRLTDAVVGSKMARRYHEALFPNIKRVGHLFYAYVPAKVFGK